MQAARIRKRMRAELALHGASLDQGIDCDNKPAPAVDVVDEPQVDVKAEANEPADKPKDEAVDKVIADLVDGVVDGVVNETTSEADPGNDAQKQTQERSETVSTDCTIL